MKERPILFSGPMVRAILDGRKTQTRRIVKPCKELLFGAPLAPNEIAGDVNAGNFEVVLMPYGAPGDRLFVRESGWERPERTPKMMREGADTWATYYYDADGLSEQEAADFKAWGFKRRPSIHMPRWASRLTLEVVSVRVERLQEIGGDDCVAEGIDPSAIPGIGSDASLRNAYRDLWDSINAKRAPWESNPWVWVIEFRRLP